MLTSWRIKNFKAWQDSGAIKLAPLTVFFGENSVGKSSLGQLLLALKQSAATDTTPPQLLNLGDAQSLIDLGSFAQNLHHGNLSEPLAFELQWQLPQAISLQGVAQQHAISVDALRLEVSIMADSAQQPVLESICYTAYQQEQTQLSVTYHSAQPDALQVQIEQPSVQKYRLPVADAACPARFYQLPAVQQPDAEFIQVLAVQTESLLADVQALAALRDGPKRRYTWMGDTPESVGRAGQNVAAAILAATAQQRTVQCAAGQPEQPFAQGVEYWLQQLGVASEFSVRPVAEHPDEYQILLKNHAAACEVNLADLGFGVSQLLPVLVQVLYAQPNSTVWLEQPEIHLHSHVQAGLADVLIAGTQAQDNNQPRNVQIIVESHSEHFLNRLQRRIAEGVISHTEVALYFCSRKGTQTQIERLDVDTYGEIANWPENLFGDEMTDIAARAMAAVQRKRQQGR